MQRLLAFFFAAALLWTPAWSQSAPDALVPDLSQYILTPPAPPTPRINGAKVFGARPGSEFLFAIPASGDRPMTFAAEGLPKGLSLDPSTGFITGRVKKPGTYLVKLTARNALGEATRELRIVIGERIALTPPMGWNSWNCWARDVTQEQVLSSARAMVESGLVNHGWTYINIDDGWQGRRGGRYNGAYSFVEADARQWADWQIDYLKYDWNPNDLYHVKEMHDALRATDRDIVYSISNSAPYADAPLWVEYTDCWRTTGDIRDTWKSISSIGFEQQRWAPFCGPGHWPDADMLVVGLVGWGPKLHYTKLTADEQYTHISLWSLLASPMLIGCDIAQMDDFTMSLLTNDEVNDVNQDPLGIQAYPVWQENKQVIYAKHLEDGSMAIGFFNQDSQPAKMGISLRQLGLRGEQTVRDLWQQKDLMKTSDHFETEVASHGVVLVKFLPGNSRAQITEKP